MPITLETIRKEAEDKLNIIFPFTIESNDRRMLLEGGEKFIKSALNASIEGSISRELLDKLIKMALDKFDTEELPVFYKDSFTAFLTEYSNKIINHSAEIKESHEKQELKDYFDTKKEQLPSLEWSARADHLHKKSSYTSIGISPKNAQPSAKITSEEKSFPKAKAINLAAASNSLLHLAKKALNDCDLLGAGSFFIASKIFNVLNFINEKLNAPEKLGNDAEGYAAYSNQVSHSQTSLVFGDTQRVHSSIPIKENNSLIIG